MSNFVAEQLQNASLVITHSVKNTVRPGGLPKLTARVRRVLLVGGALAVPEGLPNLRLGWTVYILVGGALAVPWDYPYQRFGWT